MNNHPTPANSHPALQIGIDIGGTFTDFVIKDPDGDGLVTFKILSTPEDPSQAVIEGLSKLGLYPPPAAQAARLIHGSTVATNALLERKGAPTGLVTTRGFADILQIGRQNRPELYDLQSKPPPPLVDSADRFEVDERVTSSGEVLLPLDAIALPELAARLKQHGLQSIAVCLLFSFLHPEHEAQIAAALRQAGLFVSVSHEVAPEYREYERMSTTVINAYVSPVLDRYLARLESATQPPTPDDPRLTLQIMQSNGGILSTTEARRFGVRCILSGPAGGIVGCRTIADHSRDERWSSSRLITFDMGGTSTDVSLIDGFPTLANEASIGGLPIRLPVLDIHTIGSGGGSIGWVDPGGALRVGPQSAGADPGPACYGRWDPKTQPELVLPTITDANLVLGRLLPDTFLDGSLKLHPERAAWSIGRLAESVGLEPLQTALGMVAVADAHMERALRLVSVERGHDPRQFTLLSFGGAGGLHACSLARRLGIPRVLIPPYASTLSALGMLAAQVEKDYTHTVMLPGTTSDEAIENAFQPLLAQARADLSAEGICPADQVCTTALELRYAGQSYELPVPWPATQAGLLVDFHETYRQAYAYAHLEAPVEIVNLRLHAVGKREPLELPSFPAGSTDPAPAWMGERAVVLENAEQRPEWVSIPCYRAERLQPQNQFHGPALVVRADTTIFLHADDQAKVDNSLNLWVEINQRS